MLQTFAAEGVYYEKLKPRLLPCPAVEGDEKVIQLSLTEIPVLPKPEILDGLRKALTPFGTIIDISLRYSSTEGWFLGAGYAIIQQHTGHPYATLRHTITWNDEEYCYATFSDMPTWCRYCHSEGHTKYECQKASAGILFYSCDKYGQRELIALTPSQKKRGGGTNQYKKLRKTYKDKSQQEDDKIDASVEIKKSKWAPSAEKIPSAVVPNQNHQPVEKLDLTLDDTSEIENGVINGADMSYYRETKNTTDIAGLWTMNKYTILDDQLCSDSDMDDFDYNPNDDTNALQ